MASTTPPTDQRAGVRPISFVLDNGGSIGQPLTLPIRPEDLTRSESSRASVHQTLGRGAIGWVDGFGEALPSCTIAGHTGWGAGGRPDGVEAFADLNGLVQKDYHSAKQSAIDSGMDPAGVKLLFIDMLDDFSWNVHPTQFILRRSRSRPLLFQYNITLQAVSTDIDNPLMLFPQSGGVAAGLTSLGGVIGKLRAIAGAIKGIISKVTGLANSILGPIKEAIRGFVALTAAVLTIVKDTIGAITGAVSSIVGSIVGIARGIAQAGSNIFRSIAAIANLPASVKAEFSKISGAFHEALCILKNSLKPPRIYEDYSGLYGASNCSSTTGGRPASDYVDQNAFALMHAQPSPVTASSAALSSMSTLSRMDPVLAPMPVPEMNRHMIAVVNGVTA